MMRRPGPLVFAALGKFGTLVRDSAADLRVLAHDSNVSVKSASGTALARILPELTKP